MQRDRARERNERARRQWELEHADMEQLPPGSGPPGATPGSTTNGGGVQGNGPTMNHIGSDQYSSLVRTFYWSGFSACGGIRTGKIMPVLTAYFPVRAQGILGKGGLFVALIGLTGLFYPSCNRLYRFALQLVGSSVADCLAPT